ncbi:MAG: hypothetical protein ACRD2A_25730, partial [Vicinamibacterales bacterium]
DWVLGNTASRWDLVLRVNGTTVGRLAICESAVAGTADGTVHWKAPATLATDDFTVFADEITASAGAFTLFADAIIPRTLTITDIGVITNV